MNTLTPCKSKPGVYRINAPAYSAALTRSGGVPSAQLAARIKRAINASTIYIRRGDSGKWYVRKGETS